MTPSLPFPRGLETQLLEEVASAGGLAISLGVLLALKLLLKQLLQFLLGVDHSITGRLHVLLLQIEVHTITSGHNVIVVETFDEGLDLCLLVLLALLHCFDNLARISIDASDEGMTIALFSISFVTCLHHNGLATSIASAEDNDNLSVLETIHHRERMNTKCRE